MRNLRQFKKNKSQIKISNSLHASYFLSNSEKILYSNLQLTKLDLANYYLSVKEWILPYIVKRFLTIVRCPEGVKKECFYQRHLNENKPKGIFSVYHTEKDQTENYFYVKNITGLLALVQLGVLEIHPWGCRTDNIDKPDLIIFDLDPGKDVEWKKIITAAFLVKENLTKLNLVSFVKTTGGKGLHIVIPIKRCYSWDKIKIFSHTFVNYLEALNPNLFVSQMTKSLRKGKIFIDYLRNQRSATAIAPYSTRASEAAAVSTPLTWDELTVRIKPDSFTIKTLPRRLAQLKKDPWLDFFTLKQSLRFPAV